MTATIVALREKLAFVDLHHAYPSHACQPTSKRSLSKHPMAPRLQTNTARQYITNSPDLEPENTPIPTNIATITPKNPHYKSPMCTTRIRHSPSCGHTWYAKPAELSTTTKQTL
jgi:hypothetical protein